MSDRIISIFDWSGELLKEIKEDEIKFGINLEHLPSQDEMGFMVFRISGNHEDVQLFLDHYHLELNPEV